MTHFLRSAQGVKNMTSSDYVTNVQEWLWGGVDFALVENGGPACIGSVSLVRRALETFAGVSLGYLSYAYGLNALAPSSAEEDNNNLNKREHIYTPGRVLLLTALSVTFGLQLAFKIISGSAIFLLFPCHMLTMLWIYVLASPPTPSNRYLYRFMLHFLQGPLLAVLFPVDHVLSLPFERETYWLQHGLLLFVPFYMVARQRDAYPYNGNDGFWAWVCMSFGVWSAWHWVVMQGVSVVTQVNIGHMLCAAETDPFDPVNYRLIGIGHQFVCTAMAGGIMRAFRNAVAGDEERTKQA